MAKAASSRAGPKLAGKPVEVGRGGLISRQKSSRVWNNGMEWQACGPLGWEISPAGCPRACLALALPRCVRRVLSIPSSPTARLVLLSFSFSHLPATFVFRQPTGSSRGPLWSTVIFREHRRRPVSVPPRGIRAAQCSRINQCDRRFLYSIYCSPSFDFCDAGKRRRETSFDQPCFFSFTSIRFGKCCRRSSIVSPSGLLQPLRQIILQAGLLGIPLPASTPNGVPDSTFVVAVSIGFVLDSFNSTHRL